MELIVSVVQLLIDLSFPIWLILCLVIIGLIVSALYHTYGKEYFSELKNSRNTPYICFWLIIVVAICAAYGTGVYTRVPLALRIILCTLTFVDAIIILLTVHSPKGPAKRHLQKLENQLYMTMDNERGELIKKRPWYFLDGGEKIAYDLVKTKFLIEMGQHSKAINILKKCMTLDLLEHEARELYFQLVFAYLSSGDSQAAEQFLDELKSRNSIAGLYFKSCIQFGKGQIEDAYVIARKAETKLTPEYSENRIIAPLYVNLARLQECRNNIADMFRYLQLSREKSTLTKNRRQIMNIDSFYLMKIEQYKMRTEDYNLILDDYMKLAQQSQSTLLEAMNLTVEIAKQRNDRDFLYQTIIDCYRKLHEESDLDNQCMIEASTSKMLHDFGFSFNDIEDDMIAHFDHYFDLPMPSKSNALMMVSMPEPCTGKLASYFFPWGQRLHEYASNQSIINLEKYESTLETSDYAERKWVTEQKIQFIIRGTKLYDFQYVLQLSQESVANCSDSGQDGLLLQAILFQCYVYDFSVECGRVNGSDIVEEMYDLLKRAIAILKRLSEPDCLTQWADVCIYMFRCNKKVESYEIAQRLQKYPDTLFRASALPWLHHIYEESKQSVQAD